ncbi:hypothetical protein QR77_39485 [Streptomyces sp. 150FB]|uniref:hypothetical protein n=1 Tax=Streptomyces sp. 150FB TaxID=1576605 RepID=UPI0005892A5E|nr:hypothetical protein [Streptomyces sp. 150FB]KIF78228.1 hypothetical protein QR77_39485 [Streptomyces sp. 150FB]
MTVSIGLFGRCNIPRAHLRGYRSVPERAEPGHTHGEGTDVLKIILAAHRAAHETREIAL